MLDHINQGGYKLLLLQTVRKATGFPSGLVGGWEPRSGTVKRRFSDLAYRYSKEQVVSDSR